MELCTREIGSFQSLYKLHLRAFLHVHIVRCHTGELTSAIQYMIDTLVDLLILDP